MSNTEFLKHLITEDIYVLDNDIESKVAETPVIEEATTVVENKVIPQVQTLESEIDKKEESIKEVSVLPVYKKILIIVADTSNPKLNLKDKKYIAKILEAVKVDLHSISLINILNEKVESLEGVEKILAFTPNHQLDISVNAYELSTYQNAKIIVSDPLGEVSQSVDLRKKLWGVLQQMFA